MQAALRSSARRAVAISSRRGIAAAATTTKAAAATAAGSEPERDWLAEHEEWVKAMVQREVLAQMVAEEERRIARDRLRAAAEEEWLARRRRLADDSHLIPLWLELTVAGMEGCVVGMALAILVFGR